MVFDAVVSSNGFAQMRGDATSAANEKHDGCIDDQNIDARIEALIRQMTLDVKIGLLVQYSAGQPTGPGTGRTDF